MQFCKLDSMAEFARHPESLKPIHAHICQRLWISAPSDVTGCLFLQKIWIRTRLSPPNWPAPISSDQHILMDEKLTKLADIVAWIKKLPSVLTSLLEMMPRLLHSVHNMLTLNSCGSGVEPASSYLKVAGSIPLIRMSKCPWARYWIPNSPWCAGRHCKSLWTKAFVKCKYKPVACP